MQQYQAAVGEVLLAVDDRGLQRVRVRSQPLRRRYLLDLHLRPQPRGSQRVDGGPEGQRDLIRPARIPVPLLRVVHSASAVRQSSLSRSHAGKIKGNRAFVQGKTPRRRQERRPGAAHRGLRAPGAVRDLPP
nr:hypothetical protein StreXyl84_14320 [Streptomyces sp. Xyl84]